MSSFEIFKSVEEWRCAVEDSSACGLFTASNGVLMLDRRSREQDLYGPRSTDLNLIGPDKVVVPGDVAFSYIQEALRLRKYYAWPMGIH